jgi:hypothetical protein
MALAAMAKISYLDLMHHSRGGARLIHEYGNHEPIKFGLDLRPNPVSGVGATDIVFSDGGYAATGKMGHNGTVEMRATFGSYFIIVRNGHAIKVLVRDSCDRDTLMNALRPYIKFD